ncbi:hypothetical protein BH11PLA2_BH11PLA2_15020 [soil metagenome]
MKRDNHYEVAFEAFLRSRKIPFVAVDEAKRTLLGNEKIKSLDFIIVGPDDAKLVVDVKGRKYPSGSAEKPTKTWQNWATLEDIDGLDRWATMLGGGFRGVIAFAYNIVPPFILPENTTDAFVFQGETYLMRAITSADYRKEMKPRSQRWGTVSLPAASFRNMVKPFTSLFKAVVVS